MSEQDLGLELEVLALRQDRDAVVADACREQMIASPGRARSPEMSTPSGTTPMPVVVMKTPSPLPFSTTLVSPVTIGTPASRAAARHAGNDAFQIGERKPLLQDEAGREVERPRARHGDVVDGAVHRERADVAAGKEQRRDHVPVGGHDQAAGGDVEGGLVVALGQQGLSKWRRNSSEISCAMARPPAPWVMSTAPGASRAVRKSAS